MIANNSPETRVLIAKEVINILHDKQKIYLAPNVYVNFCFSIDPEIELKDQLINSLGNNRCELCAVGSLFVSSVIKFGDFKIRKHDIKLCHVPQSEIKNYLSKFFPENQMRSIEAAFVGAKFRYTDICGNDVSEDFLQKNYPKEINFHNSHKNISKLIIAIMENIIDNNGNFNP